MTTAQHHESATTGHRGWPAIASSVAMLLAIGVASQVVVDTISALSRSKAEAPTTGIKLLQLAGGLGNAVVVLLVAAVLVAVGRALAGADSWRSTAAMIIAAFGVLIALLFLVAILMSFSKVGGQSIAGTQEWATRVHLLLGGITALAAAALANEARD